MSGVTTAATGRAVRDGALAGSLAGVVGAAVMYWAVEPLIRAAIALEESAAGHGHGSAGTVEEAHSHGGDALVSRGLQLAIGLATVLVVATLIGVAFALAHWLLAARLPGSTPAARATVLAALGFVTFTLAPALVAPANPPGVGEPGTVALRTTIYLGSIGCAVALCTLVVGLARSRQIAPALRPAAAATLAVVGALLLALLPDAADPVPAGVPGDLVWDFRLASLAQVGVMWLVMGAVLAGRVTSRESAVRLAPPPVVSV